MDDNHGSVSSVGIIVELVVVHAATKEGADAPNGISVLCVEMASVVEACEGREGVLAAPLAQPESPG